ncbi:tyrosine-type recombinase/integrase [Planctomycetota bacterium]
MTNSKSKRKTRSDKFPLTLHKTGQFCKKIKGKMYYFGNDRQNALQCYLEQASYLHGGQELNSPRADSNVTLKNLCNLYLDYQKSRVDAGELTARHYVDQVESLRKLVRFLGASREVEQISTLDLQNYKSKLQRSHGSTHRINLHISIMKAVFHWARKNDILDKMPNIDAVSKVKTAHKERSVFTSAQIGKLLNAADVKMKAMIWLGLNSGFGCTDCAELKWKDLDFENKRIKLARKKTGVARNLPLWPETVDALKAIPRVGDLVFYTSRGNPWVRTIESLDKSGVVKYVIDNAISKKFAKLLKKANITAEKGTGFYTLRRTAATLTAASGDPFAVQRLLGHADLKMASIYVQDVSEQTDRAINNARNLIIQDDS